jgi:plasmid stabilization system protein ParE
VRVRVSPTARQQINLLAVWWNEHRRDARVRVEDAFEAAVAVISEHPDVGRTYSGDPRYKTWRLKGTPYVLFYRVDQSADTVWVVVAWSGRRGAGPELP